MSVKEYNFSLPQPVIIADNPSVILDSSFIKESSITGLLDIALGTKNRDDWFKAVISNLNSQSISSEINLWIMDGNNSDKLSNWLSKEKFSFNSIYIDYDSNHKFDGKWPVIYNHLFSLGMAEFLSFWADDVLIKEFDALSRCINSKSVASVLFPRIHAHLIDKPVFRQNIPCVNHGTIRRDAFEVSGGLNEDYLFYYSDFELSIELSKQGPIKLIKSPVYSFTDNNVKKRDDRDTNKFNNYCFLNIVDGLNINLVESLLKIELLIYLQIDDFSSLKSIQKIESLIFELIDFFPSHKIFLNNQSNNKFQSSLQSEQLPFSLCKTDPEKILSINETNSTRKIILKPSTSQNYNLYNILGSINEQKDKPIYLY